jgi:DNA-binding IscR family transcriptional regulator
VLASIAASHPHPISSARLAAELQLPEGALIVTLRSLHRRRAITPVPGTAHRGGGWTLSTPP